MIALPERVFTSWTPFPLNAMKPPPDDLLSLLHQAAALRAAGKSWDAIGHAVDRAAETVRRWREHYPAEWGRYYLEAETYALTDAALEGQLALRSLLRSKNENSIFKAGNSLLRARLAERQRELKAVAATASPESADQGLFLERVKEMSDEELNEMIEKFVMERGQAKPNPEPDLPDPVI
jgi:hypothetical protein